MPPEHSLLVGIAKDFGFPVALVAFLLWYMLIRDREKVAEMGRLTRIVALVVLAMQFAPQFHSSAEEIYEESLKASRKRKDEGLEEEESRRDHHK